MNLEKITAKKKRLDNHRPLPGALVRNLDDWFRIELTFTSNALEGNTLTRQETAMVVEKGLTVGGKTLVEHLEATNHARALDWVNAQVKRSPRELTEEDILYIHALVLKSIDDEHAGYYRRVPVRISGSTVVMPNPLKVSDLMAQFQSWLHSYTSLHAVELAAEAHYRLVTIHPFVDGNGRTARLLMNLILMMLGYPPAIIRKRDRLAYVNSLERAQLGGSKADYFTIITKAVNRSLEVYLKAIEGESDTNFDDQTLLKIGGLAKASGESSSTIRHWTKEGLLEVTEITESGYQLYAADMVHRIQEINAFKKQRYTLQEIKELLSR
ncbi:Fic family protein [Persicitalea sp.]|uniref:Fic family protein n=1 Tax=Persicitalea sp. TaxID=3100273 RepID=UPI003593350D